MDEKEFKMNFYLTQRGFLRADFNDLYGSECSIQESSLAEEYAIWLGVSTDFSGNESTRMHLNQEMAEVLIPLLQRFVRDGRLS